MSRMNSEQAELLDRYFRETSKNYKQCHMKNNIQSVHLSQEAKGFDTEAKLSRQSHDNLARDLRKELHKLEKARENCNLQRYSDTQVEDNDECFTKHRPTSGHSTRKPGTANSSETDPYPVNFKSTAAGLARTKMPGKRGRRQSMEFEDLAISINHETGKLQVADKRILPNQHLPKHLSLPKTSENKLSSSAQSLLEMGLRERDNTWVGDPEAISSVRRPRKTAVQIGRDHLLVRRSKENTTQYYDDVSPNGLGSPLSGGSSPMNPRRAFAIKETPGMPSRILINSTLQEQISPDGSPKLNKRNIEHSPSLKKRSSSKRGNLHEKSHTELSKTKSNDSIKTMDNQEAATMKRNTLPPVRRTFSDNLH